jgi:uncharacterized Tic20 family protein
MIDHRPIIDHDHRHGKKLRSTTLTVAVLVIFLAFVVALVILLGLVLASLTALTLPMLSRPAALLALSELIAFLLHIVCH